VTITQGGGKGIAVSHMMILRWVLKYRSECERQWARFAPGEFVVDSGRDGDVRAGRARLPVPGCGPAWEVGGFLALQRSDREVRASVLSEGHLHKWWFVVDGGSGQTVSLKNLQDRAISREVGPVCHENLPGTAIHKNLMFS